MCLRGGGGGKRRTAARTQQNTKAAAAPPPQTTCPARRADDGVATSRACACAVAPPYHSSRRYSDPNDDSLVQTDLEALLEATWLKQQGLPPPPPQQQQQGQGHGQQPDEAGGGSGPYTALDLRFQVMAGGRAAVGGCGSGWGGGGKERGGFVWIDALQVVGLGLGVLGVGVALGLGTWECGVGGASACLAGQMHARVREASASPGLQASCAQPVSCWAQRRLGVLLPLSTHALFWPARPPPPDAARLRVRTHTHTHTPACSCLPPATPPCCCGS